MDPRDGDEVHFIQEAFGFRACCNISSWTLVFTFAKMVYSCCLVLLVTFTLMLIATSSRGEDGENWRTLQILGICYLILSLMVAFLASRVFIAVAEAKAKVIPKITSNLISLSICKLIGNISFLPCMHYFGGPKIDTGLGTLGTTFISMDSGFTSLYCVILFLFLRKKSKSHSSSDNVAVMKCGSKVGFSKISSSEISVEEDSRSSEGRSSREIISPTV